MGHAKKGPQKITFAQMRSSGVRGLLVYGADYHCSDQTVGDRWPDEMRLSDLEPRFVCSACGNRVLRPDYDWDRKSALTHWLLTQAKGDGRNRAANVRGPFIAIGDFDASIFSNHHGCARTGDDQCHTGISSRHFPKERLFNE
jgi:hypothetical protein